MLGCFLIFFSLYVCIPSIVQSPVLELHFCSGSATFFVCISLKKGPYNIPHKNPQTEKTCGLCATLLTRTSKQDHIPLVPIPVSNSYLGTDENLISYTVSALQGKPDNETMIINANGIFTIRLHSNRIL